VGRWFMALIAGMVTIGPALVWLGGGWLALHDLAQIGVIVAFIQFIGTRLYGSAAALAGIQVQIVSALAVFERIFDYLDMKTEEYEPPNAAAPASLQGDVVFENVTFGYAPERDVLVNVSME